MATQDEFFVFLGALSRNSWWNGPALAETEECDHENEEIIEEQQEVAGIPPMTYTATSYYYERCGEPAPEPEEMEDYDRER